MGTPYNVKPQTPVQMPDMPRRALLSWMAWSSSFRSLKMGRLWHKAGVASSWGWLPAGAGFRLGLASSWAREATLVLGYCRKLIKKLRALNAQRNGIPIHHPTIKPSGTYHAVVPQYRERWQGVCKPTRNYVACSVEILADDASRLFAKPPQPAALALATPTQSRTIVSHRFLTDSIHGFMDFRSRASVKEESALGLGLPRLRNQSRRRPLAAPSMASRTSGRRTRTCQCRAWLSLHMFFLWPLLW